MELIEELKIDLGDTVVEEARKAINKLKNGKTAREDNITGEQVTKHPSRVT